MGALPGLLPLLLLVGVAGARGARPAEPRAAWVTVPRQLSPRAGDDAPALSYWLNVAGRPRVLRLQSRRGLVSRPFTLVTYGRDGTRQEEHPFVRDNCFYQGHVLGSPGSLVALSTCGTGLHGMLWVEDDTYQIEPVPNDPAFRHILHRMEEANSPEGQGCGLTPEVLQQQKAVLPWFKAPKAEEENEKLKDWWTHIRYVKIVVVVDHVRFVRSGRNKSEVLKDVMHVINVGDVMYKQLSLRLFLIGLEIWTESNFINITNSLPSVLTQFNDWRKANLLGRLHHDVAHLFALQWFGGSLGLAYIGTVCDSHWAAAVISFTETKLSGVFVTFVHELGHNLGMLHDKPGCYCKRKTCIMYENNADTDAFSDCSYKEYFQLVVNGAPCLRKPPEPGTFYTGKREYCGNKVVESGEQCDCGSPANCRRDPCCHANCTFTAGSVCAFGKCCKNCQFLQAGTLCRASTGSCDLPEYCNGLSPHCPLDVYKQDGTPCKDGVYCYKGKCSSHSEQCQNLFGKQARVASLDCFKAVNTQGDRFGNCGILNNVYFTKCSTKNVLCGRIQCENIVKMPFLQNHVTLVQTPVQDKKCWGLDYHVGMPRADVGAVEDGTPCGSDMLCINRTCRSVLVLNYDCNMTKCHGRGVCNNRKNCHCEYGWAPPYCKLEGFGGSIDSGPPPARKMSQRAKVRLILFSFFFMCIIGVALSIRYRRKIEGWLTNKKARFHRIFELFQRRKKPDVPKRNSPAVCCEDS
ncbi:disintegrin and metalloproteinase domain-containing protein 20-like [Catharus ustulatus]|uniref:disintegrin and metalloproteinase domain-containing protein 20-like n=1 Tax=Catharus ustulatus TaxID=91951 RepID=UPI00140743D1|nr:disintegrin and metalloproteinase domain-containing protein 20-like [Catharus ustulatus]